MASIRRFGLGSFPVLALVCACATGACSSSDKGALILAVSTDMQAPKDINVVSLYITTDGVPKFNYMGRVLPDGTVSLPSTLAIVEPDNEGAEVRIRLVAFQAQASGNANARVLRDVVTTVPHARTALLRMPLNFLDDGSGQGSVPSQFVPGPGGSPDGDTTFDLTLIASKCDWDNLKQTSVNGVCTGASVDSSTLQPYATSAVFGDGGVLDNGAPTSCFDVATCFAQPTPVTNVDMQNCSFPLPAGASASTLNVALSSQTAGTCTANGCFVPLPNDANEGWTLQGNTVTLVPGVCAKLGPMVSLFTSVACPSESLAEPVCEPGEFAGAADAGAGCDGDYVVTCGTNPACGTGSGGMAPVTVKGGTGSISIPMGHTDAGGGGPIQPITLTVDPTTCLASFTIPASMGYCDGSGTVSIDLGGGTVSGVTCGYSLDGGSCAYAPLSCTVARGTLTAGIDAGPPADGGAAHQDASMVGCPTGQTSCSGGCVDLTANQSNCGQCGFPCAATQTCLNSQCVASSGPDAGTTTTCLPTTCMAHGYNCGPAPDGCGGLLDCGTCAAVCGGAGFSMCGTGSCTPMTCLQQGIGCGPAGDGCGNLLDCGSCPSGQTCGGGGVPSQCGP
jgi:hypothetical protein